MESNSLLVLQPCHDLRPNDNWLLETKYTKLPKYFNHQYMQFYKSHNFHSTGEDTFQERSWVGLCGGSSHAVCSPTVSLGSPRPLGLFPKEL